MHSAKSPQRGGTAPKLTRLLSCLVWDECKEVCSEGPGAQGAQSSKASRERHQHRISTDQKRDEDGFGVDRQWVWGGFLLGVVSCCGTPDAVLAPLDALCHWYKLQVPKVRWLPPVQLCSMVNGVVGQEAHSGVSDSCVTAVSNRKEGTKHSN
ncbi:hypothetical protein VTK73DRAFT_7121 [Phialemonium thermophilum]|uniref:Uncharacterized protein n=1 Tax=Phialemonium thermophilum TaxID=223376 RepID=A0ABR3WGD4_9PEZI